MTSTPAPLSRRAMLLVGSATVGLGLTVVSDPAESANAYTSPASFCNDLVSTVLNTALLAEHLGMAFYYTALTSPAVMRDNRLGGSSLDPNNPGLPPNGNPHHVRYLQAALDAEEKHALSLRRAGAKSPFTSFYFPRSAFHGLGHARSRNSFLGMWDFIESVQVGVYAAAVHQFLMLGRHDLATHAARIMGVEAEHRALSHVLDGGTPINTLTLEQVPYSCASDAAMALGPFVTGHGFPGGSTPPIGAPSSSRIKRVVGKYSTRVVTKFI